jgi:hypothetical protein
MAPNTTAIMRLVRGLAGLQREEFGSVHFRLRRWIESVAGRAEESARGTGAMRSGWYARDFKRRGFDDWCSSTAQ